MMKRMISILISVLMLSSVMLLVSCGKPEDDKTHDEVFQEIADLSREKNEQRRMFLSSDIYAEAYAYLSGTLDGLLPESEYEISLEPGSLFGDDLSAFADFAASSETRLQFFSKAEVYIKVDFWSYGWEAKDFADALMAYQISGELAVDEFGKDVFEMDAVSGKAVFSPMPGV